MAVSIWLIYFFSCRSYSILSGTKIQPRLNKTQFYLIKNNAITTVVITVVITNILHINYKHINTTY